MREKGGKKYEEKALLCGCLLPDAFSYGLRACFTGVGGGSGGAAVSYTHLNISEGEVFIPENVSILRLLSWCCIAAGLVCLFSALYYMPFLIVSAAAAFVGLILRVVKNVFAEAVRLKDENDYTI